MEYSCITDIGLIREKNQDSYLAIYNEYGDFLMLVADGIGGGKAGEVASGEVIKYFEHIFKQSGPFDALEDVENFLRFHLTSVNKLIYDLSSRYENYSGMGTTITGLMICKYGNISINCGDSRVYGFIENSCIRFTKDHTLVNQMLEKGQITYEQSLNHPKKHYLVKAIGIFEKMNFDINLVEDMKYYLACSDGLHSYVSDEEMKNIILDENKSVEDKVVDLKDLALLKGGFDNITIVLVKV